MSARLLVLCATLACSAPAAVLPTPVAGDSRVRTVLYEPENVVTIYGAIGIATMIMFDKDEFVLDMDGGDSEAWHLGVVERKNGIFVKPKASSAATNINVVTTKRVYNFDMVLAKTRKSGFMRVQFHYPAPASAPALSDAAALEKARIDKLLAALPVAVNRRYTVQGSAQIAPIEAWDDGTSTYLRFTVNGGVPAIYAVGADGGEHLENLNTSPTGLVQVQGVRPRFALRIGATVACLFNEGFDPAKPALATNTVSPQVRRVIKGAIP